MTYLSDECRQVLSVAQFNARAPLPQVAKRAKVSEKQAEKILSGLAAEGGIYPICRVSYQSLGYNYYVFWTKVEVTERKRYGEIIGLIATHPNVAWASSCAGDFDFEIGVIASSVHRAHDIVASLGILFSKVCSTCERYYLTFDKTPLSFTERGTRETLYTAPLPSPNFDDLDLKITEHLQRFPLSPISLISESLGEDMENISQRLEGLYGRGVILGAQYRLRPDHFGLSTTRLLVRFDTLDPGLDWNIRLFARRYPSVTSIVRVSGDYDFDLAVEGTVKDARTTSNSLIQEFGERILRVHAVPIEKTIKSALTELTRAIP